MSTAEDEIRALIKRNPDLKVDYSQSDPRLSRAAAFPGQATAGGTPEPARGPESDLEEALLNYIKAEALPIPVFGYRFDPRRRWRFDMAYIDKRIAIEVDGGINGIGAPCPQCGRRASGGHNSAAGFTADREKRNAAQIAGWIVLGVTAAQINSGQATNFIRQAFNFRLDQEGR